MRISIITKADFGQVRNLKTPHALSVVNKLRKEGVLKQILCRRKKNFDFTNCQQSSIITQGAHLCLFFLDKLTKSRYEFSLYSANLQDLEASLRLQACDLAYYVPYGYPISVKKANKKGITTIVSGTSAHPYCRSIMREERKLMFGIDEPVHVYGAPLRALQAADWIVACSPYIKKAYTACGIDPKKIKILPLGVDTTHFSPVKKKDKIFRVLMVCNYTLLKGAQYLLEAWSQLNLKDAELVLLGNKDKETQQILERYKGRINNLVLKDFGDPVNYYQQCSVLVHPSLTEGFEKVSLEAMACGKPVIVTEHCGASQIITEGKEGYVVPIRDVKKTVEHLKHLYEHQEKAEEMGAKARALALQYTWERFAEHLYTIFEEVYNERQHSDSSTQ